MTEESCGVHWLLDLRYLAPAIVVLVGLVVVFTRLMR